VEVIPGNAQTIGTRNRQEDSFAFSNFTDEALVEKLGFVAVVADGMGGLSFGKEASQIAVHTFLKTYLYASQSVNIVDRMIEAIHRANQAILDLAMKESAENEVGTTLISVVILKNVMYWVSIGDSRIYLFRNTELIQLTEDHKYKSILYQQAMSGKLTKEEADMDPRANWLTSYLGKTKITEIDFNIEPFYLKEDDIILLCTDGLYDFLPEVEMKSVLAQYGASSAQNLIDCCIRKKHKYQDNITAVTLYYKPKITPPKTNDNHPSKKIMLILTSIFFVIFLGASIYFGIHHLNLFD
jgi:PPM family protein phosphatase